MRWVDSAQAQELFSISRSTLWRWKRQFRIRSKRREAGGPVLLCLEDLQEASVEMFKRNPVMRFRDETK